MYHVWLEFRLFNIFTLIQNLQDCILKNQNMPMGGVHFFLVSSHLTRIYSKMQMKQNVFWSRRYF